MVVERGWGLVSAKLKNGKNPSTALGVLNTTHSVYMPPLPADVTCKIAGHLHTRFVGERVSNECVWRTLVRLSRLSHSWCDGVVVHLRRHILDLVECTCLALPPTPPMPSPALGGLRGLDRLVLHAMAAMHAVEPQEPTIDLLARCLPCHPEVVAWQLARRLAQTKIVLKVDCSADCSAACLASPTARSHRLSI